MTKRQWLAASEKVFNETSLRNRISYVDRWGLPEEVQRARDEAKRKAFVHDQNIRNA